MNFQNYILEKIDTENEINIKIISGDNKDKDALYYGEKNKDIYTAYLKGSKQKIQLKINEFDAVGAKPMAQGTIVEYKNGGDKTVRATISKAMHPVYELSNGDKINAVDVVSE